MAKVDLGLCFTDETYLRFDAVIVGCQYYKAAAPLSSLSINDLSFIRIEKCPSKEYPNAIGVYLSYSKNGSKFSEEERIGSIAEDYLNVVTEHLKRASKKNHMLVVSEIREFKLTPDGRIKWFVAEFVHM